MWRTVITAPPLSLSLSDLSLSLSLPPSPYVPVSLALPFAFYLSLSNLYIQKYPSRSLARSLCLFSLSFSLSLSLFVSLCPLYQTLTNKQTFPGVPYPASKPGPGVGALGSCCNIASDLPGPNVQQAKTEQAKD